MKDWNTDDHHIADTDHGTLTFEGDVKMVIADWEVTEAAPDTDGRIYKFVEGWVANDTGSGTFDDPYVKPLDAGRARLVRSELRGQQPFTDRDAHVAYDNVGRPHPNTWDHPGHLVTISWMDRRIDQNGQPIPEDEIGRTEWTNPETGAVFDLTEAYVPEGELYYDDPEHPFFVWRHYDHWKGGIPVLEHFWADSKAPAHGSEPGMRVTDGTWVKITDAPTWSEQRAALNAMAD
jgi:hypothetical protein